MNAIVDLIKLVQAHIGDICNVIAYVIAIASIAVKITPTPKDDAILAKVVAFVSKYIALNKVPTNPNA